MTISMGNKTKKEINYFRTQDLRGDLKKHAIQGGGITVLSRAAIFIIQMITTMVLARILSPEEFGLVAMVMALSGFTVIFIDLGLTDATIQTSNITHKQISNLFWINVAVTLIVVIIIMSISPLVAWFYSDQRLINITIVWSTYLFLSALSAQHISLLKRRMLFLQVSANEIVAILISSLIAISMALHGFGYWALVFRQISFVACGTIGAWILCRWCPGVPFLRSNIQSMIEFGRNATGSFIIGYFARNLDKILIGWRHGASELGYYHRAYYLFVLPTTQLTEALKNVATSTLSKLRREPARYQGYYTKALSLMAFIGMPISFFFLIESEDLILLFFGSQWERSIDIFKILAAGTGVWVLYSTKYWLHASLGRSDRLIRWGIIDFFVTAAAIGVGLKYGPKGVALAYTGAIYLLVCPGLIYAGKPIGLKLRSILAVTMRYFLSALIAGGICWHIVRSVTTDYDHIERLILSAFLYTIVYLFLVLAFYRSMEPFTNFLTVFKRIVT